MQVGDRVNRIEDRESVGATIVEIIGDSARIIYDEGGEGWWPIDALELME